MISKCNEPAFPQEQGNPTGCNGKIMGPGKSIGGLTKREYFAAMAMQGFCANADCKYFLEKDISYIPKLAAKYADSLIEALK